VRSERRSPAGGAGASKFFFFARYGAGGGLKRRISATSLQGASSKISGGPGRARSVLEKAGQEKAEPKDEAAPPKQHADTLYGAIKSKIFADFLQGLALPQSPLFTVTQRICRPFGSSVFW